MTSTDSPLARLAIIGGSGLYDMADLVDKTSISVPTPWGMPSDDIVLATLAELPVAFLPRHGRGHRFTPSEVPYRANIAALKSLGVEFVLSVSAVGSMREEIAPGHLVIVDQFIDRTVARDRSFFGAGVVGHVPFADPVCEVLRKIVVESARKTDAPAVVDGGTYICIEGPTFSTKAESKLFRSWGVSVIGMTNLPEARLVREAGMSYATIALATDYDCWHETEEHVSVEAVIAIIQKNVRIAQDVIRHVAATLAMPDAPSVSPFTDVTKGAVMTAKGLVPRDTALALSSVVGDLLG
jgi:5'-methylthioadenosine phosphorylase